MKFQGRCLWTLLEDIYGKFRPRFEAMGLSLTQNLPIAFISVDAVDDGEGKLPLRQIFSEALVGRILVDV